MEVKLVSRETEFFRCALDTAVQQEETLEMIVPDSMPDVGRIIFVGGTPLMRSKEAVSGRASASGVLNLSVVYIPEDGSRARRVEAALPFTASVETQEIGGGEKLVASAALASADARAVNPRKLVLRADVITRIAAYEEKKLVFACPGEAPGDVELLTCEKKLRLTTDVREKTFVISDEFSVAAAKPEPGEILKVSTWLSSGECKTVGSKLIFKGEARVDMLYASKEDGALCRADFSAGFSQVIEMAAAETEREYSVSLMLTGAYYEPAEPESDPRRILMELHIVAQATAVGEVVIEYIEDAACPKFELELEKKQTELRFAPVRRRSVETGRISVQTPTVPARVLDTELCLGKCRGDGERFAVTATAYIVYAGEDGGVSGVTGRAELSCGGDADGAVCALAGESAVSMTETGFELRVPYEVTRESQESGGFTALTRIEKKDDAPRDMSKLPSLVLVRTDKETLWSLAKRYCSTVGLIKEANGVDELPESGLIMIPKMR